MRLASDDLLSLAWTQAWQIAIVAIAVAVVVKLTCRRRPHLAYLLWMLVIVKAVTPPVWSSPTGAFSWARAETIVAQTVVAQTIPMRPLARPRSPAFAATGPRAAVAPADSPTVTSSAPLAPETPLPFTAGTWILLSWLVGSFAVVALVFVRWIRLLAQLQRTSQPVGELLQRQFDELRGRLDLRRPVRLVVTSDNLGPAAFGWWRGKVLLPQAVAEQSQPSELAAILAHELVHLRRFDPLIGSLQLAVQCVWWFHPAVWWANRQIRVERERACDEEVLAELRCPPSEYARLLVQILTWRQQFVPAVFWSGMRSWDVTSERLRHVLETTTFHRRSPAWTWLIAAIALVVILPGAGSRFITAAPPEPQQDVVQSAATGKTAPAAKPPVAISTNRDFGTLTVDEQAVVVQLEKLGIECSLSNYGPASTSWSWSSRGQLHFDTSPIPLGKLVTFVHVTLPPNVAPEKPLPLDRLPSLTSVQVGVDRFSYTQMSSDPLEPTEAQLRQQLKSLENIPASATLNILYSRKNAEALRVLPTLPQLERLALWPNFASVPSDKFLFRLDALRLRALAWMSDGNAPTNFDNRLPEIAKQITLERLVLSGRMDIRSPDQLLSLRRLRTLSLTRHWEDTDRHTGIPLPSPGALSLNCLNSMPLLEELAVDTIDDIAAAGIGRLAYLKSLSALGTVLSDGGLEQLAQATQLRTLWLGGLVENLHMTSKGLAALGGLSNLESLRITNWNSSATRPLQVTDESIAGWQSLAKLEELNIEAAGIGDASLDILGGLPKLRIIVLHGKLEITDDGLAPLAGLSKLQMLILPDSRVTGAGLTALVGMNQLQTLSLAGSPLENPGMAQIAKIDSLRQLDVSRTKITGRGLADFAGKLPRLKRLNLADTDIDDEGAAALLHRKQLQELDVTNTRLSLRFLHELTESEGMLRVWSDSRGQSPGGGFQPIEWRHFPPATDESVAGKVASAQDTQSESTPARDETAEEVIKQLEQLGLRIVAQKQNDSQTYYADFKLDFEYRDEALPLDELPGLKSIAINDRLDLSEAELIARLKAVRKLQPETMLLVFFAPGQGAAFDLLAEIPGLRKLGIMPELPTVGRTLDLGDLTQLQQLTLGGNLTDQELAALTPLAELDELQLYQSKPYAKLDFAFLENKPKLKRIMTGGIRPTDAAFARIGKLVALENLAIDVAEATDAGIAPLANLSKLETLTLGSSGARSRVTPAGLRMIGKLSTLKNLYLSGEFSPLAGAEAALADQIVADWPEQLKELKTLQMIDFEIRDEGLVSLSQLPSLDRLMLHGKVQVSDRGRRALGSMTRLRYLALADPGMNDAGLAHLRNLTNLEWLTLGECKLVSDAGLSALAELTKLKKLSIRDASLLGAGFAALEKLGQLESLSVADNPIDDAGVAKIVRLKSLRELDLRRTKITDEALRLIGRNLPELKKLNISGTNVTDAGLAALQPLKQLREVEANFTKITNAKSAGLTATVTSGSNLWTGELEVLSLEAN